MHNKNRYSHMRLAKTIGTFVLGAFSIPVFAISYGVYDPRALGMGGATIAASDSQHAHFYNPALLSFENEDENHSQNGRFVMPGLVVMASEGGKAAKDLVDDELADQISSSIDAYNADPASEVNQLAALNALQDFDSAIDTLNHENVELEVFAGLSVSEPADREGGSFYFGVRGLVFGKADVSEEDLSLMDDYIDALNFVVTDGAQGEANPQLYNGNGLIDPRPNLTSEATVSSLVIGEWGIAVSKEFPVFGVPIAFGATPKIMQAVVYRDDVNFVDDIPSYGDNKKTYLTMNLDLGIAADVYENFRVGLAVRDVLEKTFKSENDLEVTLKPRVRMGAAYLNKYVTVGLDYDLVKNSPAATEDESQELALGLEFHVWSKMDLRLGYRQDMAAERDDIVSAGLRYQIWRFEVEAAYAASSTVEGGALQLGFIF